MPNTATPAAFAAAAEIIGCSEAAIRAVFAVEAGGRFFNADGSLVSRFEPHHFPRDLWGEVGFNPGTERPWRASLRLSDRKRRAMFARATDLDPEAAADATSWGAPQIMGFNAEWAGYDSALDMVAAMRRSADEQVLAFARFIVASDLDGHLRSHDWLAFAAGYNGTGQAATYAARIERAYSEASGGARSPVVLRAGMRGDSVAALQTRLVEVGYLDHVDGAFGPRTDRAVREFQAEAGLPVDGIVGARTWEALRTAAPMSSAEPAVQPDEIEAGAKSAISSLAAGGGGATIGTILDDLDRWAQILLVGGFVLAGAVVLAVWALPRLRRGWRA